jgi:hypothetical protein
MSGIEAEIGHFGVGGSAGAVISRNGADVVPDGVVLDFSAVRDALSSAGLPVGGQFIVECYGPDGNLKWEDTAENGVTDAGIASLLNIYFRNQTQIASWYIGLVDNSGFVSFASADTMSSHAGWSEVSTGSYSNANRLQWSAGAPSGGAIVNASTADHNMTPVSALTVKGLFLTSDNTKGGTTGTLFSTAAFTGGTQTVNNGDTLKVTYTVSASSA